MATSFTDVFSAEEIDLILNINEVARARLRLIPNMKNTVNFNAHLPMSMKQKLRDNIGLNLSEMGALPMRWIQGDTIPHIDSCASPDIPFDKTHLMYLTDSEGTLDIDGRSYPIETGAAYVFSEGVHHGTSNTGLVPRLVLGPMNEFGAQVGIAEPAEILIQPFVYGKKFVGGNRDASSIAAKRTMITLNNFKRIDPIDPKKKSDTVNYKDVNSALTRVRGGGYIVPKKVTNRYLL